MEFSCFSPIKIHFTFCWLVTNVFFFTACYGSVLLFRLLKTHSLIELTEGTLLMLSCSHMNNWYPHVKIGYLSFNTDIKYFAVRDFYILQSPNLSSYFYIGAKWTARRKQNLGLFRLYFVYSVCAIQIVDFGGSFMCVGSFCILIRRSEWLLAR